LDSFDASIGGINVSVFPEGGFLGYKNN